MFLPKLDLLVFLNVTNLALLAAEPLCRVVAKQQEKKKVVVVVEVFRQVL